MGYMLKVVAFQVRQSSLGFCERHAVNVCNINSTTE